MSIRIKLLVIFLIISVFPTLFVGSIVYIQARQIFLERLLSEADVTVAQEAREIEGVLDTFTAQANLVSLYSPIQGIIRANETGVDPEDGSTREQWAGQLESIFSSIIRTEQDVFQLRYIDQSGQEVVRVDTVAGLPVVVGGDALQNKSDRAYFQEALTVDPERVYISPLNLNVEEGEVEVPHVPVFRVAKRVVDARDGTPAGMVVINVFAERVLSGLYDVAATDTTTLLNDYAVLTDQDGQFLVHPDKEKLFGAILKTGHNFFSEQSGLLSSLSSEDSSRFYNEEGHEFLTWRKIFYEESNSDLFWVLFSVVDEDELFSPIASLQYAALLYMLIAIAVVLVFALLIGWSMSNPVIRLTGVAKAITAGRYDEAVDPALTTLEDERGKLAKSIEVMRKAVQRSQKNLEKQVDVRTKDLVKAQHDLDKKLAEVKKFNDVMVGRELRMVELKKELEGRSSQTESPEQNK